MFNTDLLEYNEHPPAPSMCQTASGQKLPFQNLRQYLKLHPTTSKFNSSR